MTTDILSPPAPGPIPAPVSGPSQDQSFFEEEMWRHKPRFRENEFTHQTLTDETCNQGRKETGKEDPAVAPATAVLL
ncbi:hypothetical protein GWI33_000562 [Rhynchophorus ferrugineus]|uniref:Uncharacterized protein n=1 Tax=Rhynchophorus ferrugineus TaxID=354439 RepID=A0A834ILX4_RHYFE|nr:hypothetical protein GWI33_000562 [Rhynchophorus ferrugineus]